MNDDPNDPGNEDDDINLDMEDDSFDDFGEQKNTLGGMINDNPMLKIGLIAGAVIVVFGGIILLGGNDGQVDQSVIGSGADVSAPPGTEAASQDYVDAVREVNERDVEEAQATGGSALPTPIEPPVGVLTLPEQEEEEEDPLQRWRRLQEERLERELEQTQTVDPEPVVDTGRGEAIAGMAELMSQQMQAILDSRENRLTHTPVTTESTFDEMMAPPPGEEGEAGGDLAEDALIQEILLPAGEIAYAQLLTEANTDAPGPVLAQIMSGPLKGNRILGSFEAQRDVLTLTFNTVVVDGKSIAVDAIALDPDTTLPGLATEVDNRYLARVLLPAAAAFVEGAAEAVAESGRTTITIQGETVAQETSEADDEEEIASGIEEAGQELREIIDEEVDDIEPMIRIDVGTPMGILFLEPVVRQEEEL